MERITGLDSRRELRGLVADGSNSPPDCYSLPSLFEPAKVKKDAELASLLNGADYGARTRHLHLGKVALYQMS